MEWTTFIKTGSSESDPDSADSLQLPACCSFSSLTLILLRWFASSSRSQSSGEGYKCGYYGAAGMTMGIHDGGGGGGGGSERGSIGVLDDSAARRVGNYCGGNDDDGDGGEPYVVFGYGSLIFRVRPSFAPSCSSPSLVSLINAFLSSCAFAASSARHQNKYASPHPSRSLLFSGWVI
jgi:hypothetical protein